MKSIGLLSVGRSKECVVLTKKNIHKAEKINNYFKNIVSNSLLGVSINHEIKLKNICIKAEVYSFKCKDCKQTKITFDAYPYNMKFYERSWNSYEPNIEKKTWQVSLYFSVDKGYTRDELVKKAIKRAKKTGVKIFKKNLVIQ